MSLYSICWHKTNAKVRTGAPVLALPVGADQVLPNERGARSVTAPALHPADL
jgi:hypothetical protein